MASYNNSTKIFQS